jgi:hypothetical protein
MRPPRSPTIAFPSCAGEAPAGAAIHVRQNGGSCIPEAAPAVKHHVHVASASQKHSHALREGETVDYAARLFSRGEDRTQRKWKGSAMHRSARSRRGRTPSPTNTGSLTGLLSARSLFSILSFWSVGSILSFGSILSMGSAGSILSIGSAGSILSIGSTGSILSIGSVGSILSIGSAGSGPNTDREESKPDEGQ